MVRIIYDYQIFWRQKYGDISRYFYDLAIRPSQFDTFDTPKRILKKLSIVAGAEQSYHLMVG